MTPSDRTHRTISLIGMPGAGKSTVGVILAKRTGLAFTDTDLAIQVREGEILQDIVDRVGNPRFREIEESLIILLKIFQGWGQPMIGGWVFQDDKNPIHLEIMDAKNINCEQKCRN